jgi:hypothetical protein
VSSLLNSLEHLQLSSLLNSLEPSLSLSRTFATRISLSLSSRELSLSLSLSLSVCLSVCLIQYSLALSCGMCSFPVGLLSLLVDNKAPLITETGALHPDQYVDSVSQSEHALARCLATDEGTIPLQLQSGEHRCTVYMIRVRHWVNDSSLTSALAKVGRCLSTCFLVWLVGGVHP